MNVDGVRWMMSFWHSEGGNRDEPDFPVDYGNANFALWGVAPFDAVIIEGRNVFTDIDCSGRGSYPMLQGGSLMRNWLDNVRGREWRVWCRNLDEAGGAATEFAGEHAAYGFPAKPGEEAWLAHAGTKITGSWGPITEELKQACAEDFSDKDIEDVRQAAIKVRLEARGCVAYVRSNNTNRGYYQPYYSLFQDMVDRQVEIWDTLLQFCDSRSQQDLDAVGRLLDECEHLGDEALLRLPGLVKRRREESRRQANRIALWTSAFILVVALSIAGIVIYIW